MEKISSIEHIRLRPGLYLGVNQGNKSHPYSGYFSYGPIYMLLREILNNSVDEFRMGEGKHIEVTVQDGKVCVRDYGRGIPLEQIINFVTDFASGMVWTTNRIAKCVGMGRVGLVIVNALSKSFAVQSFRDGKTRRVEFKQGKIVSDTTIVDSNAPRGTMVEFEPDSDKNYFGKSAFQDSYIEAMMWDFAYQNVGLTITCNGKIYSSPNGLYDFLSKELKKMQVAPLYPIIHLKNDKIEIALTHSDNPKATYFSFVNGFRTLRGGIHQKAFRRAVEQTFKKFLTSSADLHKGIIGAITLNVIDPVFGDASSRATLAYGSMSPDSLTDDDSIEKYVNNFVNQQLGDYLCKHPEIIENLKR